MKKLKLVILITLFPTALLAIGEDSIKHKNFLSSSTELSRAKISGDERISTLDNQNLVKSSSEESFDLVYFENREIPLEEDLYRYQVSTLEFEVAMDYNNLVRRQINYFGNQWQSSLKKMVTKSKDYFPIYEEILDQYDMPLEIKYLSIIESSLNPFARSRSGAVGPWQFMPATGRSLDLNINYNVDERRSVEKSTHAACQYLKQMYNTFGDWHVALASYNCGPGNVRKAIRNSGRRDFWGMYNYLPRETQNYVPKFIAMAYLMNFYEEFGITPAPYSNDVMNYTTVYCKQGLDFKIIAEKLRIDGKELLSYNPELKVQDITFTKSPYYLNVPSDKVELYYENLTEIELISEIRAEERRIAELNRPKYVYHTVRRGECLPIIAKKYGCTVTQLKSWNGIRGSVIHPNQKIKIVRR